MNTPTELRYTKDHEWAQLLDDVVTMGITDFAQQQLTDIVFVELPEIGKNVLKGENLCVVESVKSVSDIFTPVSGKVVEVNNELSDKPELVNSDPYGKGWMAKIKCSNKEEFFELMEASEYIKHTESENEE